MKILWSEVWKRGFRLMQILDLLGMYFDAEVVFVTNSSLLFRFTLWPEIQPISNPNTEFSLCPKLFIFKLVSQLVDLFHSIYLFSIIFRYWIIISIKKIKIAYVASYFSPFCAHLSSFVTLQFLTGVFQINVHTNSIIFCLFHVLMLP